MGLIGWSVLVFVVGYLLNTFYITVFYHRGLAHGAVRLSPRMRRFVGLTGNWVTGLDPKAWACMHRLHHRYSDTPDDPHSPVNVGIIGIFRAQLKAYEGLLTRLIKGEKEACAVVSDIDIPVHWLNRNRLWWLPYAVHVTVAVLLGVFTHSALLGYAYFAGLMSHPVEGWLVNSFGHKVGYRNFELADQSRNNTLVAWAVMGEGYQNNHHRFPGSARFSVRWFEIDPGYGLCRLAELVGILEIASAHGRPRAPVAPETTGLLDADLSAEG